MAEPSGRATVERYARALQDKDLDALALLITDDYVDEMPQSGERVRGKANQLALVRNYPGGVGTIDPKSARLVSAEDRWVLTPTYAIGETWQMIQIIELRLGKVAKTTSWFAAPFEAPEWRTQYVERFPPLGA